MVTCVCRFVRLTIRVLVDKLLIFASAEHLHEAEVFEK